MDNRDFRTSLAQRIEAAEETLANLRALQTQMARDGHDSFITGQFIAAHEAQLRRLLDVRRDIDVMTLGAG